MNQGERDIQRMQTSVQMGDRRNFRRLFGSVTYYFAFAGCLALILIVWYFAAHKIDYVITFPYIEDVLARFFESLVDPYFWHHFLITLVRVLKGVGVSVLIGFPVGMAMGFSPFVMRTLAPYINALRQIPITAWVPMAIIWFGLGDGPTIFIITFSTVFVVILNVVAGIQDISHDLYNAVRSMGATTKDVLADVVLPGCTSGLITGIRMALGGAWMTVM